MKLSVIAVAAAATFATATMLSFATATPAAAAFNICKGVKLKVENKSNKTIQLFDIDYYDYGSRKWRSEPVRNTILEPGDTYRKTRNLEKVNRAETKIRARYRTLKSNGRWDKSKYYFYKSAKKICKTGTRFSVSIYR